MKKPAFLAGYGLSFFFVSILFFYGCNKQDQLLAPSLAVHVTYTLPEKNQQGFAYNDNVAAVLNQLVDTSHFFITLTVSKDDTVIQGAVKTEDSLVTFVPETELLSSTSYTATLTLTKKGTPLPVYKYQWNFTTKEPDAYRMTQRSTHVTDFVRDGSMNMQIGNFFYSFGGWTDNGGQVSYNDVYRSSGDLSTWEKMPDAPWHPRHVFGCVKKDGKVWVLGGDNLDTNWDLWNSEDGLSWTKINPSNPEQIGQRLFAGYCTHKIGNKEWLYIVGGYGFKDILRSLDGITWETVTTNVPALASPELPEGEGFSNAVASFNGNLYLICGGGGMAWGPPRKTVFKSTDNGITWQQMPDFPGAPRRYTNVTVFDGKIWVVGGYNDNSVGNLPDVWYMTKNGTWYQFPTPPEYVGRHATGVEVYNNNLVITCGNYNNDCWVIEKIK